MESVRCRFCGLEIEKELKEAYWICPSCKRKNEYISAAYIEKERQKHYLCPNCRAIFRDQPFGFRFPCPSCGSYVRVRDYKVLIPKRKSKSGKLSEKEIEDKRVKVSYSKIEERGDLGKDRYLREIIMDQIQVNPRFEVLTFAKGISRKGEEEEEQ
ncbi:MAG: hypothetical protein ACFFCQ_07330 [Promethearchaeota archaeon]